MTPKRISLKALVVVLGMILATIALPQPTLAQSSQATNTFDSSHMGEVARRDAWLRAVIINPQPTGF